MTENNTFAKFTPDSLMVYFFVYVFRPSSFQLSEDSPTLYNLIFSPKYPISPHYFICQSISRPAHWHGNKNSALSTNVACLQPKIPTKKTWSFINSAAELHGAIKLWTLVLCLTTGMHLFHNNLFTYESLHLQSIHV